MTCCNHGNNGNLKAGKKWGLLGAFYWKSSLQFKVFHTCHNESNLYWHFAPPPKKYHACLPESDALIHIEDRRGFSHPTKWVGRGHTELPPWLSLDKRILSWLRGNFLWLVRLLGAEHGAWDWRSNWTMVVYKLGNHFTFRKSLYGKLYWC